MTQSRKHEDRRDRGGKRLPPEEAQLYQETYRRTWEKCQAGGVSDRNELARLAHEAAVLAMQGECNPDEAADERESLRSRRD